MLFILSSQAWDAGQKLSASRPGNQTGDPGHVPSRGGAGGSPSRAQLRSHPEDDLHQGRACGRRRGVGTTALLPSSLSELLFPCCHLGVSIALLVSGDSSVSSSAGQEYRAGVQETAQFPDYAALRGAVELQEGTDAPRPCGEQTYPTGSREP